MYVVTHNQILFLCCFLQSHNRSCTATFSPAWYRFVLQLGDVIDGTNKRQGQSEAALTSVKTEIDRLATSLPLGVLNSLGNHELYNFPKERWAREV